VSFSPELAEIRFGCGLSPVVNAPQSAQDVLDRLTVPDQMQQRFPIDTFAQFRERNARYTELNRKFRKSENAEEKPELREAVRDERRMARRASLGWMVNSVMRWTWTEQGLRERLVGFWADHFSARGKTGILKHANATYIEEAIRPLTTGRFSAMLAAVVTHPLMLHYLDQSSSVGPGSDVAKKNKRLKGLNENLAREVLELHTLGIDGPYDQSDVRQLAELFTGMSQTTRTGFRFKSRWAEPGSETILGKTYGGGKPSMDPIFEVLEDLALHPVTAQHLCRKLAVHFLADDPDQGLIKHMTARYLSSDGDLMQVYAAMLEHPASWEEPLRNVKPPFAFVASACRALAVRPEPLQQAAIRKIVRNFTTPLEVMGQTWLSPGGPDGWPEEDFAWINPQGLAMRMRWSMVAPENLQPQLPDPRGFHTQVLGRFSTPEIGFAAQAAETRAEGIGLTLISPAFQRR